MLDDPGLDPYWRQEVFLIATTCLEPDKWPTWSPVMGPGALSRHRAAGAWCEDCPPPSGARVKSEKLYFCSLSVPLCHILGRTLYIVISPWKYLFGCCLVNVIK